MSDLARAHAKIKLQPTPQLPLGTTLEETEDTANDSSSTSSVSSTGTIIPANGQRPAPVQPVPWTDFFAQELYLEKSTDEYTAKYHVYLTPPVTEKAPVFVLHHGAGSSGMSFAMLSTEIRSMLPESGILAVEAREHGSMVWDKAGAVMRSLSLSALSQDLINMVELSGPHLTPNSSQRLVLVGHSLGGAVVTEVAKGGRLGNRLVGYAVLDVVEGSALETVKSMSTYLASRPTSFASTEQAVEWHVRSRTLRNPASARASVPPLLRQEESGQWTWRTDLRSTEPFWDDWFRGMSKKFLEARGAKLLLLAGTDRLDKDLMIGQMQGKFQMSVFPAAGHFIHEDLPTKTAESLVEFFRRNDSSSIKLPPKVSEMLAQGKKV